MAKRHYTRRESGLIVADDSLVVPRVELPKPWWAGLLTPARGMGRRRCCCGGEEPTGACCADDETCSVTTESDCIAAGGTWRGEGVSCSPNPCQSGADCAACVDSETPFLFQVQISGCTNKSGWCNLGQDYNGTWICQNTSTCAWASAYKDSVCANCSISRINVLVQLVRSSSSSAMYVYLNAQTPYCEGLVNRFAYTISGYWDCLDLNYSGPWTTVATTCGMSGATCIMSRI